MVLSHLLCTRRPTGPVRPEDMARAKLRGFLGVGSGAAMARYGRSWRGGGGGVGQFEFDKNRERSYLDSGEGLSDISHLLLALVLCMYMRHLR